MDEKVKGGYMTGNGKVLLQQQTTSIDRLDSHFSIKKLHHFRDHIFLLFLFLTYIKFLQ